MKARRAVGCPSCQASVEFSAANPWRPFCSERCRLLDLGAWAAERYRIAAREDDKAATEGEDAPRADDSDPESR